MNPVEELGLLKMDFLGLSNLTIIKNALRIIKRVHDLDIDLNGLPLDDPKTFELLQRGDTTGVFQFESSGMKRYLRELKPTEFDDVIAMGALYRPGPLSAGLTDSFIKRKNGLEKTSYGHPLMQPALESTYGVLVYQEQFMQISRDVCGFTGGEADTLRKAIGKKKRDMMAKMEKRFVEGAVENGVDRVFIQKFWKQLLGFADYCFNKSHSACYGLIAYQTAYLKAHYPAEFMAALMTSDYDDTDRLAIEITECKAMGIEVLPPDVNESYLEFAVVPDKNQIRFGLSAIKNVGTAAVEEILRARAEEGSFASLEDFASKVSARIVNRKTLESLIKAGAFDRFVDRVILLGNLDAFVAYANRLQKEANSGQTDMFAELGDLKVVPKLTLETAVEQHNSREQLLWERELLGLYLSQHPLQAFEDFLREQAVPLTEITPAHDGKAVTVAGAISEMREITTKKGQKMAFVKIADMKGETELILFPNAYQQTTGIWQRDHVVLVQGKVNSKDREGNPSDEVKIMVDDAREVTVEQAQAYQAKGKDKKAPKPNKAKVSHKPKGGEQPSMPGMERVYIRLENSGDQNLLISLKETIDTHIGETEVVLVLGAADKKQIVKLPGRMSRDEAVLEKLHSLVGKTNVKVQ